MNEQLFDKKCCYFALHALQVAIIINTKGSLMITSIEFFLYKIVIGNSFNLLHIYSAKNLNMQRGSDVEQEI